MTLGDNFAIFETFAGQVYGIGKNDYGQLGTGDNVGASTFVRCEELEKWDSWDSLDLCYNFVETCRILRWKVLEI